jgi:hypothetical protein
MVLEQEVINAQTNQMENEIYLRYAQKINPNGKDV